VNFFVENLRIFRKAALPLFILVVLSNTIDQYLNLNIEQSLQSPTGLNNQAYFYGLLSILSGVVFPVVLMTISLFAIRPNRSQEDLKLFIEKYTEQIFIETLRAWGKSLLWALCFILPGIWKFIEYSLVPIIVTSSEDYEQGKVDALHLSSQLFRKHWFQVLFIIVVFHLFIPLILTTLFDAYRLVWKTPLASLFLSLLDTYILLISTQLLFDIFKNEVNTHADV
jgi:hypothetical protein